MYYEKLRLLRENCKPMTHSRVLPNPILAAPTLWGVSATIQSRISIKFDCEMIPKITLHSFKYGCGVTVLHKQGPGLDVVK